jgi:hypothetical protein
LAYGALQTSRRVRGFQHCSVARIPTFQPAVGHPKFETNDGFKRLLNGDREPVELREREDLGRRVDARAVGADLPVGSSQ